MRATDPIAVMHRQWSPHYESRPYRPSPGRREHIHGPILPMHVPRSRVPLFVAAVVAVCLVAVPMMGGM